MSCIWISLWLKYCRCQAFRSHELRNLQPATHLNSYAVETQWVAPQAKTSHIAYIWAIGLMMFHSLRWTFLSWGMKMVTYITPVTSLSATISAALSLHNFTPSLCRWRHAMTAYQRSILTHNHQYPANPFGVARDSWPSRSASVQGSIVRPPPTLSLQLAIPYVCSTLYQQ